MRCLTVLLVRTRKSSIRLSLANEVRFTVLDLSELREHILWCVIELHTQRERGKKGKGHRGTNKTQTLLHVTSRDEQRNTPVGKKIGV